ncbi:MAG: alpha/beta family hydrolase [Deltaproteobacteria bacterium]
MPAVPLQFTPTPQHPPVSALWSCPPGVQHVLVLGHGAGSTLNHPLMARLSAALEAVGVATFRFNYPYSERGRGMDPEPVRLATVRAVAACAAEQAPGLPLFAGGHSMSGRMFTLAQSREPIVGVRGLVCFAFPLHSGAPNVARAAHLSEVRVPLLFLSGTRDKMADKGLLSRVAAGLPAARLHWIDTADHSLLPLKSRASSEPVFDELARLSVAWMAEH